MFRLKVSLIFASVLVFVGSVTSPTAFAAQSVDGDLILSQFGRKYCLTESDSQGRSTAYIISNLSLHLSDMGLVAQGHFDSVRCVFEKNGNLKWVPKDLGSPLFFPSLIDPDIRIQLWSNNYELSVTSKSHQKLTSFKLQEIPTQSFNLAVSLDSLLTKQNWEELNSTGSTTTTINLALIKNIFYKIGEGETQSLRKRSAGSYILNLRFEKDAQGILSVYPK